MIGLFGGTFDPVHNGHLRSALDVFEALELDELRFIPLGRAVHREQPGATDAQRLAMLQAAIKDQSGFCVDERELKRDTPSYTVLTLHSLRQELGHRLPLCLLVGRDAFNDFAHWREPEHILEMAHLVIMERPGVAVPTDPELLALMNNRLVDDAARLRRQPGGRILFQPVTPLDISSSDIRKRLSQGRSVRYLLPEAVRELL